MTEGKFSEQQILDLAKMGYEEGNPSFEVNTEDCALLVIDMQDEFVKPHWTPYWVPESTRQIPLFKKLIGHCRQKRVPVIYTVYSRTHNNLDRPKSGPFMPNRFQELDYDQSDLFVMGKVWHEIAPKDNEIVIHKSSYGAFYDTPLETILRNLEKDTIIVTGLLTNYCCGATARQGYDRSFKVIFGSDLTSTDAPEMQEYELKIMRRGFAKVLSCHEIIKSLG